MANNNTTALFITQEYLKRNSSIQENVDGDQIRPYIALAMDKWILASIGSSLYQRLITDVAANTLSGSYLTLMTVYIQPALVWLVQAEAIEWFTTPLTNKGAQNKNGDFSKAASEETIMRLEAKALVNGQYYLQRLSRYLWANTTSFTEFTNCGTTVDTIPPNQTSYFSGIFVPSYGYGFNTMPFYDGMYPCWMFYHT